MTAVQEVDAELHKFLKKLAETNLDKTVYFLVKIDQLHELVKSNGHDN